MQLIVVSQDGKAFVDTDFAFCIKIDKAGYSDAFDILAVSGSATQWLGTYDTEEEAATMLSMLLVKKFDPRCSLFMLPKRDDKDAIDDYRAILDNTGDKQ
jgi:hypothetical protein